MSNNAVKIQKLRGILNVSSLACAGVIIVFKVGLSSVRVSKPILWHLLLLLFLSVSTHLNCICTILI